MPCATLTVTRVNSAPAVIRRRSLWNTLTVHVSILSARAAGWLAGSVALFLASVSDAQTVYAQTHHEVGQTESTPASAKPNSFSDGKADKAKPNLRVYKYNKDGVVSFSDRAPMSTRYEVVTYSCFACNPASKVDWYSIKLNTHAFTYPIDSAARKHDVDRALVRAVIHAESAFRESVISRKGAVGLMQLMPGTARDMGVKDALSPAQNIHGGVRYLAYLLKLHGGNITLAVAAYNAGPGAVKRYDGIPPYAETEAYVKRVRILHKRYKDALAEIDVAKASHQASNF